MATVTIPGALADHLTAQTIADADTVATLDAAHRGRGRTLVIEATSTRVLHVISAYAEAILENRKLHTAALVRAARLWIQRAGHAPAPAAEQAPAAVRDEPSDWWTIMDPATGEEIARVHGETWQDMTPRAQALPEVRSVIRKHNGFSRRRLYVSELTPAQALATAQSAYERSTRAAERVRTNPDATDPEWRAALAELGTALDQWKAADPNIGAAIAADETPLAAAETARCTLHGDQCDHDPRAPHRFADLHIGPPAVRTTAPTICPEFATLDVDDMIAEEMRTAAALVTEAEATEGTWRGEWIGEQPADDVLFVADGMVEQGALFDGRATP
ncbi:hypothetical protein MHW47_10815 [Streptomyces sp. OfavH-34-F]|uniref:hypothetical protein n=1 Tax=Streptomyces sp. OfavH-34-F TaxID=2917760 RepID=UPI001EF1C0D3|nr:hypothetical protein [Streptomyces sp. OfavH-34-F]MCG7524925.1 hypothetical protein [Streptomyces sp. OfavH-34-F]